MGNFECDQCGECCLKLILTATENDIERWQNGDDERVLDGKPSIVDYLETFYIDGSDKEYASSDIWMSPVTGEELLRCPWLRKLPNQDKYICRINDCKPDCCSKYECDISKPVGQRTVKKNRNEIGVDTLST